MRTVIGLGRQRASVEHGRWEAPEWLQPVLVRLQVPAGYVPDYDYALAQAACAALGGTIVAYAGPPAGAAGRVE